LGGILTQYILFKYNGSALKLVTDNQSGLSSCPRYLDGGSFVEIVLGLHGKGIKHVLYRSIRTTSEHIKMLCLLLNRLFVCLGLQPAKKRRLLFRVFSRIPQ